MRGVTPYQFEVLQRVSELQKRHGTAPDLDQILELLSWMPSKASVQFTLRAMVDKKLISKGPTELRRGRVRVVYLLERLGKQALDPRRVVADAEVDSALTEPPQPEDLDFSLREVLEP